MISLTLKATIYYHHLSEPLAKGDAILREFAIRTDLKINRPDIVAKDYKRKKCLLIDMAVPMSNNISVKEYG